MPTEREHEPPRRRLRRLRRERDALFSDLGALVYELHRRGERAPELLHEKAGELAELDREVRGLEEALRPDPEAADRAPGEPAAATRCEACGRGLEPGQLVGLSCGARLQGKGPGLRERLPAAESLPGLALLLALVVIGCGALGYAIASGGGDDERREASSSIGESPSAPTAIGGSPAPTVTTPPEGTPPPTAEEPVEAPAGEPQPPASSLLQRWPADLSAHTVVLVTSSDRAGALHVAREAARSGLEAGLVDADRFDLGSGLWIVFAGRYKSRDEAATRSVRLGERYPGAYPQLMEPRGQ